MSAVAWRFVPPAPVAQVGEMPGAVGAVVQLLVSAAFAGLVVQLLLLRQNRRKIEGEASSSEANAASTLSGAALKMLENAQNDTATAKADAVTARTEAAASRQQSQEIWTELNHARWTIHHMSVREQVLLSALRAANIEVPMTPPRAAEHPDFPAPDVPTIGEAPNFDY